MGHADPRPHNNGCSLAGAGHRRDDCSLQRDLRHVDESLSVSGGGPHLRLTVYSKANSKNGVDLNGPQIRQLQQLHSVEGVLAMDYDPMNLTGHDLPENDLQRSQPGSFPLNDT